MTSGEAVLGIRMERARYGEPAFFECIHSGRRETVRLAATEQYPSPKTRHPRSKYS